MTAGEADAVFVFALAAGVDVLEVLAALDAPEATGVVDFPGSFGVDLEPLEDFVGVELAGEALLFSLSILACSLFTMAFSSS